MNSETEHILVNSSLTEEYSKPQKLQPIETTIQNKNSTFNIEDDDIESLSNICRTCANITEFVIPIFIDEGLQNNLADKIEKHLPIKVSEYDSLPHVVCYQCASTLLAWHDLVQCCVQADTDLRKRFAARTNKSEPNVSTDQSQEPLAEKDDTKFKNNPDEVGRSLVISGQNDDTSLDFTISNKNIHNYTTDMSELSIKTHSGNGSGYYIYCNQCRSPVDRQNFAIHVSKHVVDVRNDKKIHFPMKSRVKKKQFKDLSQNGENEAKEHLLTNASHSRAMDKHTETNTNKTATADALENDFSDHSDAEYFCELPKSVFEAIEDSQDTQTREDLERNLQTDTNEAIDHKSSHVQTEVSKKTTKRSCPICSKVYTAKSSYFYHMKHSHNSYKEHECDVCGKKFTAKPTLAQHLLIHTNDNPYECKECGKKFQAKASLYIHEQIHFGQKTFSCAQCNQSFRWRAHYERHSRRHDGQKSHVCVTCGRGFSVRCDLLRHTRTHSVGNHACQYCGLKFAQLRYLKTHVAKKHSKWTNVSSLTL